MEEKLKNLRVQSKDLLAATKNIDEAISIVQKNIDKLEEDPFEVEAALFQLQTNIKLLAAGGSLKEKSEIVISELEKKLTLVKEKYTIELGDALEKGFKKENISLSGHFPELKAAFFTLDFKFKEGSVDIYFGPKIELLKTISINIEKILNEVVSQYKKLNDCPFTDDSFIADLFNSYQNAVYRKKMEIGAPAPISNILLEFALVRQGKGFLNNPKKELFKTYERIQFAFDLFRAKKRDFNGYVLNMQISTREQTRNLETNLWIPSNLKGEGTHISAIMFKR